MSNLVAWFTGTFSGLLGRETMIFLISMIPILELRGGLLAASPAFLDVPMWRAILLCAAGNLLPVPFILALFTRILRQLKRFRLTSGFAGWLEQHAMKKRKDIERLEFWGLALFVGIPLPGTGAWTGTMVAALLGMKWRKAVPAILMGIVMATVIMALISYGLLGTVAA